MDCMAAKALKSSLLSDIGMMKSSQPQGGFGDDMWCVTGLNNVPCDDFSVDDLLDLSDKDFKDGPLTLKAEEDEDFKDTLSLSSSQHHHHHHRNSNFSSFSETDDFGSLLAAELSVPAEEMENLEWLSQFVDDSGRSELSLLCPAWNFNFKDNNKGRLSDKWAAEPSVQMIRVPCFPLHFPVKPRSKRSRPNGRGVWSGSQPSLTSTAESSSTSSSSYGSSTLSPFIYSNPVQDIDIEKPPAKKQKKAADTGSGPVGLQTSRRCSHCQVNKTPQWRTGPMGPKTLCNACGVRYKSGRLFPEYRPACSPTFSQEAHSNSHRKVLEMRRKKETTTTSHVEAAGRLTILVPSF